jgi:hypothetical protein
MSSPKTPAQSSAGFEVTLTVKAATREDAKRVVDAAIAATQTPRKESK